MTGISMTVTSAVHAPAGDTDGNTVRDMRLRPHITTLVAPRGIAGEGWKR